MKDLTHYFLSSASKKVNSDQNDSDSTQKNGAQDKGPKSKSVEPTRKSLSLKNKSVSKDSKEVSINEDGLQSEDKPKVTGKKRGRPRKSKDVEEVVSAEKNTDPVTSATAVSNPEADVFGPSPQLEVTENVESLPIPSDSPSPAQTLDPESLAAQDCPDDVVMVDLDQEILLLQSNKAEDANGRDSVSPDEPGATKEKSPQSNVFSRMMTSKKSLEKDEDNSETATKKNKLSLKRCKDPGGSPEKKQDGKKNTKKSRRILNSDDSDVEETKKSTKDSKKEKKPSASHESENKLNRDIKKKEEANTAPSTPVGRDGSNAFMLLMAKKEKPSKEKGRKSHEPEEVEVEKSRGKKKRAVESDDEIFEAPKSKPASLYGYFTPVGRDVAMRSGELTSRKVAAEVHHEPSPPDEERRRSVGPVRRSLRRQRAEEDEITVLDHMEKAETPVKTKMVTPKKLRKRRGWQLKIRLLSPAKPLEELSEGDSSDLDSDYSDYSLDSPVSCHKNNSTKNLPLAPIFLSKRGQPSPAVSKASRRIVSAAPLPSIRVAPTEHTIGFAEVDPYTPMAVLFPSISHVTQIPPSITPLEGEAASTAPTNEAPTSEASLAPTVSSGEELAPAVLGKEIPAPAPIPPGCLLSAEEPVVLSSREAREQGAEGMGEAWCEMGRPRSSAEVVGNSRSVLRLRDWLDRWRLRSGAAAEEEQHSSDSEYDDLDDFIVSDEEDEDDFKTRGSQKKKRRRRHCNTALLVGPCGSGKTAAVYAVAEELGFKVLEMNASARRSGKRILSELQEATQSHQVRNAPDQDTLNSFFSAKDKEQENSQTSRGGGNNGLSLILVEDVDIVFEEQDEGFLAALDVLAASSKRPLVLVSNDPQCALLLARQNRLHLAFQSVPAAVTGEVVRRLCSAAGEEVKERQLELLVQRCGGDLRRAVLLAHIWSLSGGLPCSPVERTPPFPLRLEDVWVGMGATPLPYILCAEDVEEEEAPEPLADKTWDESAEDSDCIFKSPSRPLTKRRLVRQRLTSDSLEGWQGGQQPTLPSDLRKAQALADTLAALDIMQGASEDSRLSSVRPGLSDQPCHEAPRELLAPRLHHWLADRALRLAGCTLAPRNTQATHRWRDLHSQVDLELLEQLPLQSGQLERSAVALDLLPTLRCLGKSVQASARSSRRSRINGLQALGFGLPPSTLEALPFILPA